MIKLILFFFWFLMYGASSSFVYGKPDNDAYKKAEIFFFEKKFDNAKIILKKFLSKQPKHSKALSLMGDIYLFQKEYHKAIQAYERAIDTSSNPAIEHFRLGQCYLELRQFDNAKNQFQQTYALNIKIKNSLFQIGYITLIHDRNKQKTIEYWEQFITEAPNDPQYEKIKRVIELLRDPNFKIPLINSDISLEEALLLGSEAFKKKSKRIADEKAGDAKSKINNQTKELLEDENDL